MISQTPRYAVLKGDIVGSTKLSTPGLKKVLDRLRNGVKAFTAQFHGSVFGEMAVFSGDSWQLLMPDWQRSLRAALYLRAITKSEETARTDTRIAIGWGAVDKDSLNRKHITEATGEAFTRSGRTLENMNKHDRLAFDGDTDDVRFSRAALALADELASRWTPRQAQTVAMALLERKQEKIALAVGKKQPTINKALRASGWRGIERFLQEIEYSLKKL